MSEKPKHESSRLLNRRVKPGAANCLIYRDLSSIALDTESAH